MARLHIGDIVFDVEQNYWGQIVELTNNKAKLVMEDWCEQENRKMFDMDITEDELEWETNNLDSLYKIAKNIIDVREGNIVCVEHNKTRDDYPYFSPYLYENLFNFEVERKS